MGSKGHSEGEDGYGGGQYQTTFASSSRDTRWVMILPTAAYVLTKTEKERFLHILRGLKMPIQYVG
jgi:hypothetical protein